jgi:hypothetical protein
VILLNVAHPMSLLLAFDPRSGRTEVTSQRPSAVAWILMLEPGLADPESVWELIREPSSPQRLIMAEVDDEGGERRYVFDVDQGPGARTRWSLSLTDGGRFERVD